MNYGFENNQKRTYLDDLPSASEIDRKHIRQNYIPPQESGMNAQYYHVEEYQEPQQPQSQPQPQLQHEFQPNSISCMEIAFHVKSCPICTHYYNTNISLYIATIVLLIVIILFLLKNILHLK